MMTSDDKVGGWVKKGQNHDDVILEWSLRKSLRYNLGCSIKSIRALLPRQYCKRIIKSQL